MSLSNAILFKSEELKSDEDNWNDVGGNIDLDDYLLDRLDVAIASLHGPCIAPGSIEENTAAVIGAMKNKRVNIIGHPDDGAYPLDYEQVVKVAKETNTILEVKLFVNVVERLI